MKFLKGKWGYRCALILLIIVLVLAAVLMAAQKKGYHIDELFSYSLANAYKDPFTIPRADVYNTWHGPDYFISYLVIPEGHRFSFTSAYENQIYDVHPPFYYFILNAASSFTPGEFSMWSGLIINFILFGFSLWALYLLSCQLFKSPWMAVLVCAAYGASAGAAVTVTFIRMYMLFTLEVLLFFFLHALLLTNPGRPRYLIPLFFVTFLGFMTQYYFLITAFFAAIIYIAYQLLRRRYSAASSYAGVILAAVVSGVIFFPVSLDHIFTGYRGTEAFANFSASGGFFDRFRAMYHAVSSRMFGGLLTYILIAFALLFIAALTLRIIKDTRARRSLRVVKDPDVDPRVAKYRYQMERRKVKKTAPSALPVADVIIIGISLTLLSMFALITKIAPYLDDRYLLPLYPVILLAVIYALFRVTARIIKKPAICAGILAILFAATACIGHMNGKARQYLFEYQEPLVQIARDHSDYQCYYYTVYENHWQLFESLMQIAEYEDVYISNHYINLQQVLEEHKGYYRGFIMYIDRVYDVENVVSRVRENFSDMKFAYAELLYQTHYADVYFFHN